jgi:O-antigen/teichoic acid export membrane protein
MLLRIKNKILSKRFLLLTDQMLISGSNFLFTILLTSILGFSGFGVYASLWLWILFMTSIQQAFVTIPMYTLFYKTDGPKNYLISSVWLQLIVCVFSSLLLFISLFTYHHLIHPIAQTSTILFLLPLVSFFTLWNDYIRKRLILLGKKWDLLFLDFFVYALPVLMLYFFDSFLDNTTNVYFMLCSIYALAFMLTIRKVLVLKMNHLLLFQTLKSHWANSKFLLYSTLLQWTSGNVFIIVGANVLSPEVFGIIRFSQTLTGLFTIFFQYIENTVPIEIGKLLKTGKSSIENIVVKLGKSYFYLLIIGIVLMVLVIFGMRNFMDVTYLKTNTIITFLLILLQIPIYIGLFIRFYLRTIEKNDLLFKGYVINTVFSLSFATIMIANFGVYGLVFGLFMQQLITYIPTFYVLKIKAK